MSLTVVGSIAFDSITTPFGEVEGTLGGSAVYAGMAAALFTEVRVIAAVGDDFGSEEEAILSAAHVDVSGIERVAGAETLGWRGRYEYDMTVAHTEETRLNVYEGWSPELSPAARGADSLLLVAADPEVQARLRGQWQGTKWSALASMPYWVETKPEALVEAMRGVDLVLISDQEARELTRQPMLMHAAREIMAWGPRAVIVKHGAYGSSLLTRDGYFALPSYPLEVPTDPTGTGHAFAGGLIGYLDLVPAGQLAEGVLRRAVTYGAVMSSLCVEDMGARRLARLREDDVNYRFDEFRAMTHFEHVTGKQKLRDRTGRTPVYREGGDRTPGTAGYDEPRHTGGTPAYPDPGRTGGTPSYQPPRPSDRPPTVR